MWSVMIPTYNCADYLKETLVSVLAQDPGTGLMQIEVVDDCSAEDDPAAVVEEVGRGRVTFYQQPRNVGHVNNFNTCLRRARGHLVHLLHGDDCVREGFYRKMQRAFTEQGSSSELPSEATPGVGAAFCRYISMDEESHWQTISQLEQAKSGVLDNWLEKIAVGQRLQPPSMVVRREVYERLGGFDRRIARYGEDWEMWVRIAATYPVWYEVEPLALYRIRPASLSGKSVRTGENGRDLRMVIQLNQAHLPESHASKWTKLAAESFALACIRRAHRMIDSGAMEGALAQLQEALKTSHSAPVIRRATFLLMRWVWRKLRSMAPLGAAESLAQ